MIKFKEMIVKMTYKMKILKRTNIIQILVVFFLICGNSLVDSRIFAQDNDWAEYYFDEGMDYYFSKRYKESIEYFNKAVSLNPNDAEAYATMSAAYSRLGKYNEAVSAAKKSVNLEPNNVFNYNELGLAYRLSGNYEKALDAYNKAVSLSSSLGDYNGLGLVYSAMGEDRAAIFSYQKALRDGPAEEGEIYLNLGASYKKLGQNTEAKEYLLKAKDIFVHIKKDEKVLEADRLLETIRE